MQGYFHELSGKTRGLIFGIFTILVLVLSATILLPSQRISANYIRSNQEVRTMDSPNVVAVGLTEAAQSLSQTLDNLGTTLQESTADVTGAVSSVGKSTVNGLQTAIVFTGNAVESSFKATGSALGTGVAFIIQVPNNLLENATDTALVSAIIKPADSTQLPTIELDSDSGEAVESAETIVQEQQTQDMQLTDTSAKWPMHGTITTHFGVPHRPYQPTHTGIDISDGQPAGVTAIKPFKPGRVVETVISRQGLGNHVIVDHGNGLMSLYAHLASIVVQEYQTVDHSTTLGYQGSTGVSTGTHLHFEVLMDGQPMDPRQYITGLP